jgi:hypothetical protein
MTNERIIDMVERDGVFVCRRAHAERLAEATAAHNRALLSVALMRAPLDAAIMVMSAICITEASALHLGDAALFGVALLAVAHARPPWPAWSDMLARVPS